MCLDVLYDQDRTDRILATMPDYVVLWKMFHMDLASARLQPVFQITPNNTKNHDDFCYDRNPWWYEAKKNTIKNSASSFVYEAGFHCFFNWTMADYWNNAFIDGIIVPIIICKDDILCIGEEWIYEEKRTPVVVARRMFLDPSVRTVEDLQKYLDPAPWAESDMWKMVPKVARLTADDMIRRSRRNNP